MGLSSWLVLIAAVCTVASILDKLPLWVAVIALCAAVLASAWRRSP